MTTGAAPDIVVDENPDPALRDAVVRPLRAFNVGKVGELSVEQLAVLLRDPQNGEIIGGLWGQSVAGWMFVDLLFVPENLRDRGLGTSLIGRAEEIARKRKCTGLWLHTGTFQAPGFYERMGYQRFGEIPDFPPGHVTFFYSKRLEP